jgi:hypothetical protein
MTDPNKQHSHGGQQGSAQDGGTDPEETKVGNNSMDASKGSGKTEQRSGDNFSEKEGQQKGGDPDNPSETTGATESGAEDKGAKK